MIDVPFKPSRVILQDFTGVPAVVDLASLRKAMADIGGDPDKINPLKFQLTLLLTTLYKLINTVQQDALRVNMDLNLNVTLSVINS